MKTAYLQEVKRRACLVIVSVLLSLHASAEAGVTGTRYLNAGFTEVHVVQVIGASASGVLYRVYHPDYGGMLDGSQEDIATFLRRADGTVERLDGWDALEGDLVFNRVYDADGSSTVT